MADDLAGKRGRCPRCGTMYTIPKQSMPPSPPKAESSITGGSIYGLKTIVGNLPAPRQPRDVYSDPDRLRGGRQERSRFWPLVLLLLLLIAVTAYVYRDSLRQWFEEERETISEKIQEELHPGQKEDSKTAPPQEGKQ